MRSKLLFSVLVGLAATAYAKDPKPYQTGKLLQMDSVPCSASKTQEPQCHEYVLQSENVIYHIRPKNDKHLALLPVGERAQFRLQKDEILLRMEALDAKEHPYVVVSIAPRSDSSSADATPVRLNHLQ